MRNPCLEIASDFVEAEILRNAESRPFPQGEVDEKCEKDNPGKLENKGGERVPTQKEIADDGNKERFHRENERRPASFLNLRGDEFFRERNHNEQRKNTYCRQTGAVIHPADDKDDKDDKGNDGKSDGDPWQIEEAELFQDKARNHTDQDDTDENSDAVFYAVRVKSEQGEGDDGRRIDAESLDADNLAEKGHERGDDGEHQKEKHGLYRHALLDKKRDQWMVLHKEE